MSPRPEIPKAKISKEDKRRFTRALIKQFLPYIVIVSILEAISVCAAVFAPQYLSNLSNAVIYSNGNIDLDEINKNGLIFVILQVVNIACQYFSAFIMTTVSQTYSKRLRKDIQGKINRLPLSYFDGHQFGDILSRLTNDVDSVSNSMNSTIATLIHAFFLLTGATIAMFATSWQMALSVVVTLPILMVIAGIDMKIVSPLWKKRHNLLGTMEGEAEEQYSGQNIIKLFGAEERMIGEFEAHNNELRKIMIASDGITSLIQPFYSFMSYLAYAAMGLVGGLLLIHGDGTITMGTITAFMVYVNQFQSPLSQIGESFSSVQSGLSANARIAEFMLEKEETSEDDKPEVFDSGDGVERVKGEVKFSHINFSYDPSRQIIFDFSADIKPGYKVAIVGPTGAGKTTMVNLLMRFYEVDSGDILIDGVSTKSMPRHEVREIFGMVLQDTWLFEGTLRENLVYNTPNVSEDDIKAAIKACHLTHYIRTLPGGLDYEIKDVSSISSGEKQLITIARAFIRKAPLLILDEATSNVDTRTEEKIQEAMDNLTNGRTSFVIAHRLSTIRNADLILVMDKGNIVEQGTHDSLMEKNGFYAGLYNSQFAFMED